MSSHIIVTDRDSLERAVAKAVRRVIAEVVTEAVREAHAPEWLSREEVCERYGLTARQLTYMRTKRSVEFSQHGRRILYSRDSLEQWIDEGRVNTKSDSA